MRIKTKKRIPGLAPGQTTPDYPMGDGFNSIRRRWRRFLGYLAPGDAARVALLEPPLEIQNEDRVYRAHIPLEQACLCINCDMIFSSVGPLPVACPSCSSETWVFLISWLNPTFRKHKRLAKQK